MAEAHAPSAVTRTVPHDGDCLVEVRRLFEDAANDHGVKSSGNHHAMCRAVQEGSASHGNSLGVKSRARADLSCDAKGDIGDSAAELADLGFRPQQTAECCRQGNVLVCRMEHPSPRIAAREWRHAALSPAVLYRVVNCGRAPRRATSAPSANPPNSSNSSGSNRAEIIFSSQETAGSVSQGVPAIWA